MRDHERAHQKIHIAPGQLREGKIKLRLRVLIETFVLDVRSHADYL